MGLFRLAMKGVAVLPEPVARSIFRNIGRTVGFSNHRRARQLRKNYQRLVPIGPLAQRKRSASAMRSYFDYYYEALRLPHLSRSQIAARVRVENDAQIRAQLQSASAIGILLHMGNWDLAGAWATRELAPVYSIAEALKPPELTEMFLDLRAEIGMRIFNTGGGALGKIRQALTEERVFAPLLCDRDLSATGVTVSLGGHEMKVAPGAALLARQTSCPIFPVIVVTEDFGSERERVRQAGSKFGIRCIFGAPIYADPDLDQDADLVRINQEWIDQIEPLLIENLSDWHMLQKVFVSDLDPNWVKK